MADAGPGRAPAAHPRGLGYHSDGVRVLCGGLSEGVLRFPLSLPRLRVLDRSAVR